MLNGTAVSSRVVASTANMETDADDIDVEVSSGVEQLGSVVDRLSTELQVERAGGSGIRDGDAKDQPRDRLRQ